MNSALIITPQQAMQIGAALGVNWASTDFEQFRRGIAVELEHGLVNHYTDVTHNDLLLTAKIALAHLNELPDYYTRLESIESSDFQTINTPTQSMLSGHNNEFLKGIAVGAGLFMLGKFLFNNSQKK